MPARSAPACAGESTGSLKGRLGRLFVGILLMVATASLGAVAWVNLEQENIRSAKIEAQVQASIVSRAIALADNHALASLGLVRDNVFTDLQRLVQHTVKSEPGVVYGAFVSAEGIPWAYVSPTLPDGTPKDFHEQFRELAVPEDRWGSDERARRDVVRFGQKIIEVSSPVVDDGEVLGTVLYGFSTRPLREAVAQVRADSRNALQTTLQLVTLAILLSTLIGSFLVSRAAAHITHPLRDFTSAARAVAAGKKGVRVSVQTNDELQVLAAAFNQMQQSNEDAMERLKDAMERALEASRIKGEFLANMSHEIRTPMNGIMGVTKLMLRMPLESRLRRHAETVDASASSLMTIINDVLDFSKMEAGKYSLHSTAFDPRVILQEVAELQSPRALDSGLDLVYRCDHRVPALVVADPDRYKQVLNNLVGNAIKFTEHGEVFINVTVDEPDETGAAVLRTVVQDTGIGIRNEDIPGLFEAFSQADGSMVRRHGGTGLGLAICSRLVEMMGGEISVSSEIGVGSSFAFTMRVEAREAPRQPEAPLLPQGRRALLVETNVRWAQILEEHLHRWGMICDVSQDGLSALDQLGRRDDGEQAYDIAIVGSQLPDISIDLFVRRLRSLPGRERLPLIVLTQLGASATLPEIQDEMLVQVSKPLRLSEVYNCMLGAFSGRLEQRGAAPAGSRRTHSARGRLLIVDDNEVNRYVALELVEQAGFVPDVATNGREAVEKLRAGQYAVVLMDCQMPVMDGYMATRAIRELEGDQRHTPIIALTAHALVGEREKVLSAGMDDYLSKPLNPNALERLLNRYVCDGKPAALVDAQDRDEGATESAAVSTAGLDPSVQRSVGLSRAFAQHAPRNLDELDEAFADGDAELVAQKAHKLKGSCLAIGARQMAEAAQAAQEAARDGDLDRASRYADVLQAGIPKLIAALREELRSVRPSNPAASRASVAIGAK